MYSMWIFHYALIKGIYKKRHKNLKIAVDNLATICLIILVLFILILFIDKEIIRNIYRHRIPMGPIIKGILFLLLPVFILFISNKLTKKKVKTIRRTIQVMSQVPKAYSVLYVFLFIGLFIVTIFIAAISITT
jgi:p-aminobenzoyl-glutamate transporter AbgT